ncbi:MAG: hypothetical protein M3Z03_07520 [Actinomycetota bacterium]|nr:hypothetical protein [Actinomycetota bacterium]
MSVEALVEIVAVARRDELVPGFRTLLVLCIALKLVFASRVRRLRAGPALGLLLLEGTTVVAALGAVDAAAPARLALGGTAIIVLVLLFSSLHAFPEPALPRVDPPR